MAAEKRDQHVRVLRATGRCVTDVRLTDIRPPVNVTGVTSGSHPTDSVTYLLRSLQHALLQSIDERLRPYGLTLIQFGVLAALKWSPGQSSADLARSRFVTPQTMNGVIASLWRARLITRRPHPQGGRVLQLRITAAGEEVVERCSAAVNELERTMLEGMPATDQKKLRDLLRECLSQVSEAHAAEPSAS
jgi:DNA-binding MarR family transcriptional regulator